LDERGRSPDGGHGSLVVLAPPPGSRLLHLPQRTGRWLADDAVVLNHGALAQLGGQPQLGDTIGLSLDGVTANSSWWGRSKKSAPRESPTSPAPASSSSWVRDV
jgi:hypothetical protein